jgi:hypothetical protein
MTQQSSMFEDEIKIKPKQPKPWIDFTPPSDDKITQVLSYGGGKQTFAMLVLIEQGKLPKPDLIIFADTGREIKETYEHMRDYALPLIERLGIPYYSVKREINGDTRDIYQYHWDEEITPIWPTCTTEFKLRAINRKLQELLEIKAGIHSVDSWIGITTDESHRNTPSINAYTRKTFPLLDLNLSRQNCIDLTIGAGYPEPPKSGCDICPHKDWEKAYVEHPEWFEAALALEENAAKTRPETRLTQYGRSLRMIKLQPKFNWAGYEDDCGTGYCHV